MSVTYYTGTGQSAFNAAVTIGLPVWETPIPEVADKILFRQEHMQSAVSYSPLALSTTYTAHGSYGVPTSSSYFLVGEENFRSIGGGLLQWERVWATVPTSWWEYENFAYTYPSYICPISIGTAAAVSAITDGVTFCRLSTTATGIAGGDVVYVAVTYTRGAGSSKSLNMFAVAQNASSGSWVDILPLFVGVGVTYTGVGGSIVEVGTGRTATETLVVSSRVVHDYAKVNGGGSITGRLDTDLPLIDAFTAIDSIGNRTMTLSTGTASRPDSNAYQSMVRNGVEIVAEQSIRERWRGNIYVRKTRFVQAR